MNDKKHRTGTDMLEDLVTFVYETDQFPSFDRAKQILAEEKIDTADLNLWAVEKLAGIKGRSRLAEVRLKRLAALESIERCRQAVIEGGSALRGEVIEKLRVLATSDPEAAQVYCRKFEEMPDEDLPDLEAELMWLDEISDERDES